MSIEESIRLVYPLPLAKVYEAVRLEMEPRLRVRKLIEFYEETIRYLALVGLSSYAYHGLSTDKVERMRQEIGRPTLGTWLDLLKTVTKALRPKDRHFFSPPFSQKYQEGDAIYEATQAIRKLLDSAPFKEVTLTSFLDTLINFRNNKIGHGSLAESEAKRILPHLEGGLNAWLDSCTLLKERHLVYIDRVEWKDPDFLFTGMNLNSGTTLGPLSLRVGTAVTPQLVYLHDPQQNSFVPLLPYLTFDRDTRLIYIYNRLSNQGEPELHCPYEPPSSLTAVTLPAHLLIAPSPPPPAAPEPQPEPSRPKLRQKDSSFMRNWFDLIQPHEDIRKGNFDEAVFAADLGDVYDGNAPADYQDPYSFFKKTYLTAGLTGLLHRVHEKLIHGNGPSVIQIKTPFGGGKTHSLVTLYHYLKNGEKIRELLPSGLDIVTPKLSVINAEHFDPVGGQQSEGVTRLTLWGEMAFQLAGKKGYEELRANDQERISPGKAKLRAFLTEQQPFVLLFDEVLEYINRAMDKRDETGVSLGTQTFSFFQELTDTVASLPNGMLVVTLPQSKLEDFGERQEESLARLGKIFGRIESIETPVRGQEVYAVIRRRLFEVESLKQTAMREVVHHYFQSYQQNRDDVPARAREAEYRQKMEDAYPFHPDVIDILYEKWSTFPSFQRTRGVLRLLANVIEDLYQQETNIDMIMPGDLNLDHPGIRQEFLKHIGVEYEGVIASDVAGSEAKSQMLDKANRSWKHLSQRIATAVFFHSFSADDSEKGINLPYIKLAVMRGETLASMVTEILQKQANLLWYLNSRGETYYFSKIPNLNRMILDKRELYNEAYEEELEAIVKREAGSRFRTYIWPSNGDGIPDNRDLKLVILRPEDRGEEIATWIERKGQSFREYKNTLFFALADIAEFSRLREEVKTFLALQEIKGEVEQDPNSPLATKRPEIQNRLLKIEKDFSFNVRRMYHTLQVGERSLDLGQPVAGNESLGNWYWRELTNNEAIVENLHYRMIVNRVMAGNEQVALPVILDQFYKNPQFPAPASQDVVARAIQLGVQDGAFGLAMAQDGEIAVDLLRFQENVMLGAIAFEPGVYLVNRALCEQMLAEKRQREEAERRERELAAGQQVREVGDGEGETAVVPPTPTGQQAETSQATKPDSYQKVRLVISGIPANRIADVNRGIFLPLSAATDEPLQFTVTIEVNSAEGISQATLEQKIKETIRQIGAKVEEEWLE